MPRGPEPSDLRKAQTGWADPPVQGRRKARELQPSPRARRMWKGRDMASSRWEEAQDKPKCFELGTQSQILPLRGKEAARSCWSGGQSWFDRASEPCSEDTGLVVALGRRGAIAPEVVSIHSPLLK